MTQKLLLAEALDLLRRTEAREYEVDRTQARVRSSDKHRSELLQLVQAYGSLYNDYLCGVEILNYVRRCALDNGETISKGGSAGLIQLCEGKMKAYMDRCDMVRKKEDNILLPLDQVDSYMTTFANDVLIPVFTRSGAESPIKRKEDFIRQETLTDGSYILVVKNLDAYSVAAPNFSIIVDIVPRHGVVQRWEKKIPGACGWRRLIGVITSATLRFVARSDGLLRDSHVDIALYRLHTNDTEREKVASPGATAEKRVPEVPKISNKELGLIAGMNVPGTKLAEKRESTHSEANVGSTVALPLFLTQSQAINPANMNAAERLQHLRDKLNGWPSGNVMTASLNKEQQCVLQVVFALPLPTELGD